MMTEGQNAADHVLVKTKPGHVLLLFTSWLAHCLSYFVKH